MVKLLSPGQRWANATGDLRTACVDILNVMLQSWASESINVPSETRQTPFTVTVDQGEYTVGPGGTIAITRPAIIRRINWLQDDIETEMNELTDSEWEAFQNKALTGISRPQWWHYRNREAATGVLNLLYIPSVAEQIVIYTLDQFTAYTAGANTTTLPPAYELAIRTNLALMFKLELVHMGATLEGTNLTLCDQMARDSLANIQRLNFRPPQYFSDFPTGDPGKISHTEFVDGTFYNW